jgi:pimeloyl-[acyl-carrier protein] methyl ester esterase
MTVEVLGAGRDVVMLHGWAMHSGVWRDLANDLAKFFRVHLVDLPGHGKSNREEFCDLGDVVLTLSRLLPRQVFVIGWSLGATITLAWAKSCPEQVRALTLIAATPCFIAREGWAHGWPRHQFESFARDVQNDPAKALTRFLSLQTRGDDTGRQILRDLRRSVLDVPRTTLAAGLAVLGETDLRHAAPCVRQNALLMHGDADSVISIEAARWLARNMSNASLSVFARCGHAPFLSRPSEFVRGIAGFLHAQPD